MVLKCYKSSVYDNYNKQQLQIAQNNDVQ